jgi:hypothetical protein
MEPSHPPIEPAKEVSEKKQAFYVQLELEAAVFLRG